MVMLLPSEATCWKNTVLTTPHLPAAAAAAAAKHDQHLKNQFQ
jgi:hypothetical protein